MITELQRTNLTVMLYNLLISSPEVGLGEIGECEDAAKETVNNWIEENCIKVN